MEKSLLPKEMTQFSTNIDFWHHSVCSFPSCKTHSQIKSFLLIKLQPFIFYFLRQQNRQTCSVKKAGNNNCSLATATVSEDDVLLCTTDFHFENEPFAFMAWLCLYD